MTMEEYFEFLRQYWEMFGVRRRQFSRAGQ